MEKLRGNRWVTLVILCIGFLMILIDSTIVNVSIPTIIRDLGANLTQVEWVVSGYALTFAALLITFGRLGDMYGRKRFFITGLFLFTFASFLCGEAPGIGILIAARIFQGIGGAMISPVTLSIISSSFKGRERAAAFGVWGALAGVAVALGPILGGYFTTYYTWRWIFRVNIPIGIIGMIAAALIIQESKEPKNQRLDIGGMVTSTIGFFFLIFGLIEGQSYGWWQPAKAFSLFGWQWPFTNLSAIPVSFFFSTVFLLIFLWIQYGKTRRNENPAVDLNFFRYRTFRYGLIAIGVIALGEFSSLFTFPIYVQSVLGYTPLQSGYATLPLALATMVAAPLSALLVNRIGSKWVITTGITLEFIGLMMLSRITPSWTYAHLILPISILGAGIGLAIAQNTQIILSEVKPEESGSASGVLNTIRQVGTALGIAIVGAVVANGLTTHIPEQINQISDLSPALRTQIITTAQNNNVSSSSTSTDFTIPIPAGVQQSPSALQAYEAHIVAIERSITSGINTALTESIASGIRVGSLFVLVGAVLSLFIPSVKHKKDKGQL